MSTLLPSTAMLAVSLGRRRTTSAKSLAGMMARPSCSMAAGRRHSFSSMRSEHIRRSTPPSATTCTPSRICMLVRSGSALMTDCMPAVRAWASIKNRIGTNTSFLCLYGCSSAARPLSGRAACRVIHMRVLPRVRVYYIYYSSSSSRGVGGVEKRRSCPRAAHFCCGRARGAAGENPRPFPPFPQSPREAHSLHRPIHRRRWTKQRPYMRFFKSSMTEAKRASSAIILSILSHALMAVVWSLRPNR